MNGVQGFVLQAAALVYGCLTCASATRPALRLDDDDGGRDVGGRLAVSDGGGARRAYDDAGEEVLLLPRTCGPSGVIELRAGAIYRTCPGHPDCAAEDVDHKVVCPELHGAEGSRIEVSNKGINFTGIAKLLGPLVVTMAPSVENLSQSAIWSGANITLSSDPGPIVFENIRGVGATQGASIYSVGKIEVKGWGQLLGLRNLPGDQVRVELPWLAEAASRVDGRGVRWLPRSSRAVVAGYKSGVQWWETVVLLRKSAIFIIAVLIPLSWAPGAQIMTLLLTITIAEMAHSQVRPYEEERFNKLEAQVLGISAACLILVALLVVKWPFVSTTVSLMNMLALVILMFGAYIYLIANLVLGFYRSERHPEPPGRAAAAEGPASCGKERPSPEGEVDGDEEEEEEEPAARSCGGAAAAAGALQPEPELKVAAAPLLEDSLHAEIEELRRQNHDLRVRLGEVDPH